MSSKKKKSKKTSIRKQKSEHKSKPRKKRVGRTALFPEWTGPFVTAILSFLLVYKITPFIPSFSASTTILLGISLVTALVVFFTMYFNSKSWARYSVLLLVILLFGANFISSIGLKFDWLSGSVWTNLSIFTICPGAALIWVAILKYSNSATPNETFTDGQGGKASIQQNPLYFSAAGAIFLISAFMIFYRLGYYNLGVDEPLLFNAARGFNANGFSYFQTGYDRSWMNAVFIGLSMRIFGESELAARLPAAIMGLVFVSTSFYVFAKGWKNRYLALLIPLLCLMNDRFLYQFRIVRMYAFLIPLFLISMYFLYRLLSSEKLINSKNKALHKSTSFYNIWIKLDWKYLVAFAVMIPILVHFQSLSLIVLLIAPISVFSLAALTKEKKYIAASTFVLASGTIAYLLVFVAKIPSLGFVRYGIDRLLKEAMTIDTYYEYMFDNGLPVTSTLMLLLGSIAFQFSKLSKQVKAFHLVSFIGVVLSFVLMAYLIYNPRGGRDYRYIAHLVPFAVSIALFTLAFLGNRVFQMKRYYPLLWLIPLFYSLIHFNTDKERIYNNHTWHPQYEVAYGTIKEQYKPGESIIGMNINNYYLKAKKLAGENYILIPRRNKYTLKQLKLDLKKTGSGWIIWPIVKMNNLNKDVINYIYKNCRHIHGYKIDDTAIEVFYYSNS